jgi:hypothetical protein
MQTAETSLIKGFHVQSGIIAQLPDILSAVDAYIALAWKVNQRDFDMITNPALHR